MYADGAIDAGDMLTDVDGLRADLESGRVVTTLEDNRVSVRRRYVEIPEHQRIFALGDMDRKDFPLRVLSTDLGEPLYGSKDGLIVTQRQRDKAIEYFRRSLHAEASWRARVPADGPEHPQQPTLALYQAHFPNGWTGDPGIQVLQNDYAAPITVNGKRYPTVTHAYWALYAPRRTAWPAARLAVMSALLRAKFAQHPDVADVLIATGDARIMHLGGDSDYWVSGGGGSNWIGRLLEVIRSELAATRAGIPIT